MPIALKKKLKSTEEHLGEKEWQGTYTIYGEKYGEIEAERPEIKDSWIGVTLPFIRQTFSKLSAKEFVSVQPMSAPSDLVFYMDTFHTYKCYTIYGNEIKNKKSKSQCDSGLYKG